MIVLDASALICLIHGETGQDKVSAVIGSAVISTVNWSETIQKTIRSMAFHPAMQVELESIGLTIVPFTTDDANRAAFLWESTREFGLSLADRACLSLALRLNAAVMTTDQAWANLKTGPVIHLLR